jgi:hypothetical protein
MHDVGTGPDAILRTLAQIEDGIVKADMAYLVSQSRQDDAKSILGEI